MIWRPVSTCDFCRWICRSRCGRWWLLFWPLAFPGSLWPGASAHAPGQAPGRDCQPPLRHGPARPDHLVNAEASTDSPPFGYDTFLSPTSRTGPDGPVEPDHDGFGELVSPLGAYLDAYADTPGHDDFVWKARQQNDYLLCGSVTSDRPRDVVVRRCVRTRRCRRRSTA